MKKPIVYTYTVLRYIHDPAASEFLNVGVVLFAPEVGFLRARCRSTFSRLSRTFPDMNGGYFKSMMSFIERQISKEGEQVQGTFDDPSFNAPKTVMDLAKKVLPADDSSLQWSPPGVGHTQAPEKTLQTLFNRLVMQYEETSDVSRRTEDDVWRQFKPALERRNLLRHFAPKTISVPDDQVEFQHTWKNGLLHCLEPVSFDLSTQDGIRDKAHRWIGRITSIQASAHGLQLYFLVGKPQEPELLGAYDKALSILNKVPGNKEIIREEDAEELSERLERKVANHESGIN